MWSAKIVSGHDFFGSDLTCKFLSRGSQPRSWEVISGCRLWFWDEQRREYRERGTTKMKKENAKGDVRYCNSIYIHR